MNLAEKEFVSLLATSPQSPAPALINIGSGDEVTIRELALLVKEAVGFEGSLVFDSSKPDGTPRKLCDVSKLHALGWKHRTRLEEGIQSSYEWYRNNLETYEKNVRALV
jgi:GDP-L-fucose synthase